MEILEVTSAIVVDLGNADELKRNPALPQHDGCRGGKAFFPSLTGRILTGVQAGGPEGGSFLSAERLNGLAHHFNIGLDQRSFHGQKLASEKKGSLALEDVQFVSNILH